MTFPLTVTTTPTPPNPDDVKAQYGFVAMLAQQIPEIATLMQQAVNENWTPDRFSMALANTDWWKQTPDKQRQWLVAQISDPATAAQEMRTGGQQVQHLADTLGFTVPDDQTSQDLWLQMQLQGMDQQGKQAFLSQRLVGSTATGSGLGGTYGQLVNEMYKTAGQYGYNPPDLENQILYWAQHIMTQSGGQGNTEGWTSQLKNYAAAKYAPYAQRIMEGETPFQIAQPYLQSYNKVLEQSAGLDDPLVQRALQGNQGDGSQPPAAVPVWQFEQDLRQDPRWGSTQNARDAAAGTLTEIGKAFGMVK